AKRGRMILGAADGKRSAQIARDLGANVDTVRKWRMHWIGLQAISLEGLHLTSVLAIRSNHGVWLPADQPVHLTRWRFFERTFSDGAQQTRAIREIISGKRGRIRSYLLTTDPTMHPKDGTWYVMTNLESKLEKTIGNTYGLRTWIEYGLKQAKNESGWADDRVTDDAEIERWWELVFSAYQLVSFHCPASGLASQEVPSEQDAQTSPVEHFAEHAWWDMGQGWKNTLDHLRLLLQPHVFSCLLLPWLVVFDLPGLRAGFLALTTLMNFFHAALPT
ncbi:MAG TPA: hypothetical protein VFV38_43150, partial [Ktedonobacteraceae bacterium]|nr:hypothetical protein [Ktedonobacteraceae bacterium]